MPGIRLDLVSFADMSLERAQAVGRAFDAHPALRPVKVGGDPARIAVGSSLEAVITERGLPVEWSTVRRNNGDDFEGGEIVLLPGRGGWVGSRENGEWEYLLSGHHLRQHWLHEAAAATATVTEASGLFEDLSLAIDAAYGYLAADSPVPQAAGAIEAWLPGVFWLNYFGPAFLASRPALAGMKGARVLSNGGVLVQTSEVPWVTDPESTLRHEAELRDLFGEQAFTYMRPNPALPTTQDHLAVSVGTAEMPWVSWLHERTVADTTKRHAAARKRLETALGRREVEPLAQSAAEWSTSLDLGDWEPFAKHLGRALRGDLSGPIGRAVVAVVATAPPDEEDGVLVDTTMGTVRLGWFIDDVDTVDVYVFGSAQVHLVCEAWFDNES
ncbi:hypothetical protein [Cellulomonas sp. Leaf334]|uniref:hypothetical protein n=1 Tax=Cellulomonas sp. Leaf334 TaxID=1736339 RepID=UPI0006F8B95D|nr:hypothetical protein [Cellulomonas sp. Leaf334]KQR08511.1 hypothetical protein ASF78_19845 [Cellulomonas sp. Leaf334]